MLNIASIMMGTSHPGNIADFYEKVLGKPADWADYGWHAWQTGKTYFMIGKHSEVKGKAKEPQRIMFNFETKDVKGEFERIRGLGAKVVKEPYEMDGEWLATFADPDGNYFQLISPWKAGK